MKSALLSLLLAFSSSHTVAGDLDAFIGTWRAHYKTEEGKERQAELRIWPDGAAWHVFGSGNRNMCIGREFPATANAVSRDELQLRVNRSEAIPGCGDLNLTLKLRDTAHLDGTFKDGRTALLKKQ
ncbi:MAG: hypothetical protein IPJ52_05155 [Rhodocyclaceae bacterium]|nr:hypothetical protein [Rhodocyclaceae bacterium]